MGSNQRHALKRARPQSQMNKINTSTLSFLVLLYFSASASFSAHHAEAAFTNTAVIGKRQAAVTSTTSTFTSDYYSRASTSTALPSLRSQSPCFHFKKDRDARSKGHDHNHYNDALLNRIISGRNSSSSLWRKRTRRAAASLGIQRHHRTEEDYIREQERKFQDKLTTMPLVPPPTSTISTIVRCAEINGTEGESTESPLPISLSASTTIGASTSDMQRQRNKKQTKLEIIPSYSKMRKKKLTQEQHERAKMEWAAKYTSIDTLRQSFGRNRNKFWGDFDNRTTRKLYHTLLPRALLGLYEAGLWSSTDLAPLAFEARIAAKKYARERCVLPGRVAAMVYDGFRSWRTWGTWSVEGMSWDQVWSKYETQILEEYMEGNSYVDLDGFHEEITSQVCARILERSCITNAAVDKLCLQTNSGNENGGRRRKRNAERDLAKIKFKLDKDIDQFLKANRPVRSPFYLDMIGGEIPASLPIPNLREGKGIKRRFVDGIDYSALTLNEVSFLKVFASGKKGLDSVTANLLPIFMLR